jgi:hypothetical protein
MTMAYTGFAERYDAPVERKGLFARLIDALTAPRRGEAEATGMEVPRRLAGPLPGDRRARGYLADLDIETGF